jgi:nicotinamide riboside kinase
VKISFEDFDHVTTKIVVASYEDDFCPNVRAELAEVLIDISLMLTGEVYRPGLEFPEPKHPKKLEDVRKNILIHVAEELSAALNKSYEDIELTFSRLTRLLENVYPDPDPDRSEDAMDLPRN